MLTGAWKSANDFHRLYPPPNQFKPERLPPGIDWGVWAGMNREGPRVVLFAMVLMGDGDRSVIALCPCDGLLPPPHTHRYNARPRERRPEAGRDEHLITVRTHIGPDCRY